MSDRDDFVANDQDEVQGVEPCGEGESTDVFALETEDGADTVDDSLGIMEEALSARERGNELVEAAPEAMADLDVPQPTAEENGGAPLPGGDEMPAAETWEDAESATANSEAGVEIDGEGETAAATAPPPSPPARPAGGPRPAGLVLMLVLSSLVIVLAGAYAMLAATGGSVLDVPPLLQKGLPALQWPAGVLGGALLLGVLGAILSGRSLARARREGRALGRLLERVESLDPEDRDTWADPALLRHPRIGRFLTDLQQALERKEAKLVAYTGLEGELFRLEKGLTDGSRGDLEGPYQNPGVDRLAHQVAGLWDGRRQALDDASGLGRKLSESGGGLCRGLQEAAEWNSAALDRFNVQVAGLEKLGPRLKQIGQDVRHVARERQDIGSLKGTLSAVREEFSILPAADTSETLGDVSETIKDLVTKGGQLAIKTATGVAALGPQGQELLGLTQELQSLVTEFRAVATRLEAIFVNQEKAANVLGSVRQKLDGVKNTMKPDPQAQQAWQSLNTGLNELIEGLNGMAEALTGLSPELDGQTERLNQLGRSCSGLTGARFEPASSGNGAAGLAVDRFEPFQREERAPEPERSGITVAPFVVTAEEPGRPAAEAEPAVEPAPAAVPPADASPLAEPAAPPFAAEPAAPPPPATPAEPEMPPAPAAPPPQDASADESPLHPEGERVYDLSEFDAISLREREEVADEEADRIYDLSEFGAVALS